MPRWSTSRRVTCVADMAATRAVSVDSIDAARYAHKIDSTLRGNWASELVARHAATGHPVLVVPAYPGARSDVRRRESCSTMGSRCTRGRPVTT